jgi:hypothetical protein
VDFQGKTFKSRAEWLIAIALAIPLMLIVAATLIPGCLRRL